MDPITTRASQKSCMEKSMSKTLDYSLLVFLVVSILISEESYKLGLGSISTPEPGLFPFILGVALGILSCFRLFVDLYFASEQRTSFNLDMSKKLILLVVGLIGYVFLMTKIGFCLSSLLLVFYLLKVTEKKSWLIAVLVALGITGLMQVLFTLVLNIRLPKGILPF